MFFMLNYVFYYFILSVCRFFHKNPEDSREVPGGFLSDCNKVIST